MTWQREVYRQEPLSPKVSKHLLWQKKADGLATTRWIKGIELLPGQTPDRITRGLSEFSLGLGLRLHLALLLRTLLFELPDLFFLLHELRLVASRESG